MLRYDQVSGDRIPALCGLLFLHRVVAGEQIGAQTPIMSSSGNEEPSTLATAEETWLMDPAEWADGGAKPLEHGMQFVEQQRTPYKLPEHVVPNILHDAWITKDDDLQPTELEYWRYLALKSGLEVQQPDIAYL